MQSRVEVRVSPGGPWLPGVLTDERAESSYGLPVVVVKGQDNARGPAEVECVRVYSFCPVELADAAVSAGFLVQGQPAGTPATWAVQRETRDGETTAIARGLSEREAEALAEHHNAGPDGQAVGSGVATYAAVVEVKVTEGQSDE